MIQDATKLQARLRIKFAEYKANGGPPVTIGEILERVAEDQGIDGPSDLIDYIIEEGASPGVCCHCYHVYDEVEPDLERGICEVCRCNGVGAAHLLIQLL